MQPFKPQGIFGSPINVTAPQTLLPSSVGSIPGAISSVFTSTNEQAEYDEAVKLSDKVFDIMQYLFDNYNLGENFRIDTLTFLIDVYEGNSNYNYSAKLDEHIKTDGYVKIFCADKSTRKWDYFTAYINKERKILVRCDDELSTDLERKLVSIFEKMELESELPVNEVKEKKKKVEKL